MATVTPTVSEIAGDGSVRIITWTPLTTTNQDGSPAEWVAWGDRCVQLSGTFGTGGTIALQGSNDGSNWFSITDPQGNAISKTSAAIEQCTEVTRYVRPYVSAGDGTTSLTAILILRRSQGIRD